MLTGAAQDQGAFWTYRALHSCVFVHTLSMALFACVTSGEATI